MKNTFKIICVKFGTDKKHLYSRNDKCLYIKNKTKVKNNAEQIVYYKCIEKDCQCRGKLQHGKFSRVKSKGTVPNHRHENHRTKAKAEMAYERIKLKVRDSTGNIREIYNEETRS